MPNPPRERLARVAFAAAVCAALLAGLWLRRDLLHAGFFADDFDHHAMLTGTYPVPRSKLDLFNFGDGTPHETRALIDSGHFPWWSDPGVQLSMWRPLSSALIAFDFHVFGTDARYFHVHSFVWWALLVVSAALVLSTILPRPVAALAVLLFALEEGHSLPVGWLANRSTLIATTFGFLALHAHLRFRLHGSRSARVATLGWLVLAFAAGEYAFGALAYFLAFEACGRRAESLRVRALALAPLAAIALAYLAARGLLGHGIQGSGFYLSPSAAPLAYLGALLWRLPVLVGELVFGIPADWFMVGTPWRDQLLQRQLFTAKQWHALPNWPTVQVTLGLVALVALVLLARRLARSSRPAHAAHLPWLALGALLALVPVCGSMVSGRLTLAASLGVDALLACALGSLLLRLRASGWLARGACAAAAALLLHVHVVRAGTRSQYEAQWQRYRSHFERAWVLRAELDEQTVANQHVVIVAAQDLTTSWYLPYVRLFEGRQAPRSYWLLTGAAQPLDLTRVDASTLELSVLTGHVDAMAVGSNYRPADKPFRVGDEVRLQGYTARVLATLRGQPSRVRFTFDASLDDPRYVFLVSTDRGLRKLAVPLVSERVRLPRPAYPNPASLELQAIDRTLSARSRR